MKELLAALFIGTLFSIMIVTCAEHEDRLVDKHCSGLTGYEYGACQVSIY